MARDVVPGPSGNGGIGLADDRRELARHEGEARIAIHLPEKAHGRRADGRLRYRRRSGHRLDCGSFGDGWRFLQRSGKRHVRLGHHRFRDGFRRGLRSRDGRRGILLRSDQQQAERLRARLEAHDAGRPAGTIDGEGALDQAALGGACLLDQRVDGGRSRRHVVEAARGGEHASVWRDDRGEAGARAEGVGELLGAGDQGLARRLAGGDREHRAAAIGKVQAAAGGGQRHRSAAEVEAEHLDAARLARQEFGEAGEMAGERAARREGARQHGSRPRPPAARQAPETDRSCRPSGSARVPASVATIFNKVLIAPVSGAVHASARGALACG